MIQFRWLGVAGFELDIGEANLLVDPFVTRPGLRYLLFGRPEANPTLISEKFETCDFILVTHSHHDHLMDVPLIMKNTSAYAYGSNNTCKILSMHGIPDPQIHFIRVGDQVELGKFKIDVLGAKHMYLPGYNEGMLLAAPMLPLRMSDYKMDACFSFLIQVNGMRLLDWTGTSSDGAPYADILLVGAYEPARFYEALIASVQPGLIIPIHWDNFFRPSSKPLQPFFKLPRWAFPPIERTDPQKFERMINRIDPQIEVFIPNIFESYAVEGRRILTTVP